MRWRLSHRFDGASVEIADRHYSRQKPGTPQFVPPGRCLVLRCEGALWVTSWPFAEFTRHEWGGAWVNSLFRNERPDLHLSSELIVEALAASRWRWPDVPDLGLVTFIDTRRVRRKRDPGRCYLRAGGHVAGRTKSGLVCIQFTPDVIPPAEAPLGATADLFGES